MTQFLTRLLLTAVLSAALTGAALAQRPLVRLQTNFGDMVLELEPERTPLTVANFLAYVDSGFYDGTIIHRIADLNPGPARNLIVQGGGVTENLQQKPTAAPIVNEAAAASSNSRGTIAMARTNDPDSATSQFFFNVDDNAALDYTAPTAQGAGYAVFGRIVEGLDVLDRIGQVPTAPVGPFANLPTQTIVISGAARLPIFADDFDASD